MLRAGMWVQQPDWAFVEQWIQQALDLAEEGSLTQGHALAALAMSSDDEAAAESPARSALAIAERLGNARHNGLWHPRRNDIDADLAALRVEAVP